MSSAPGSTGCLHPFETVALWPYSKNDIGFGGEAVRWCVSLNESRGDMVLSSGSQGKYVIGQKLLCATKLEGTTDRRVGEYRCIV
jgi:hypothetical protein